MSLPLPKPGSGLMTIAFDLDGTLSEPTWPGPHLGKPIQKGIDAAIAYREKGYELIIFTSRPRSHFEDIAQWLADHGLADVFYDIVTDKPRAALYVDDRAATFPEAFENAFERAARVRLGEPVRLNGGPIHERAEVCARHGCVPA